MPDSEAETLREPRLSASLIVRNEAMRITDCVSALLPVVDEICVLDTGSEDDTVSRARALGCRVFEGDWTDDFAAARNEALRTCRFPWVLSIDADECISAGDVSALRALVSKAPDRAYRFVTRNYTNVDSVSGFVPTLASDPHSQGFAGWFPSSKVRLFPNHPGVRFEGVVHELLNVALARCAIPVEDTPIPIYHYPHHHQRPGAQEAKQALYLRLGEQKVAEQPEVARLHSELGDQYVDMGRYGEALSAYRRAVALEPHDGVWLKNLGTTLYLAGHLAPAEQALRLAVAQEPDLEEGWRNLTVVLLRQEKYRDAHAAATRALALDPCQSDSYRYLAMAQHHQGDTAAAIVSLEALLHRFPDDAEGIRLLDSYRH